MRAKELQCFFGEDVIDGRFEEEWMDGNNILLVVSAETYWFTAIIHPLPYLLYSSFCFFSLLITFPYFQTALSLSLSRLSVPILPHCHTHVFFYTLLLLAPDYSVLDLSHVTLTCYVLQGCSAMKGPRQGKGCVQQRQETKHSSEGCVCA